MAQNSKNQREKNVILISNPSEPLGQHDLPRGFSRNSSFGSDFGNIGLNGFSRQSSYGNNLFKTFNAEEKPRVEPPPAKPEQTLTEAQKYAKECLQYEKFHFDDQIKRIIHRMSIRAYLHLKEKNQHELFSFSIQKVLTSVAKKLLLNRFQLLFLEYIFQQTKWKYDTQCINRHSQDFQSYANEVQDKSIPKSALKLEIYLLYCSFYSKKSLNEFPSENIYQGFLRSLAPRFKDFFNEWTQSSNVSNIRINPKILNNIFKRLTFYAGRETEQIENYCLLVQEIIEISPAYNPGKNGKKKVKKQKKNQLISQIKEESQMINNDFVHLRQDSPELSEIPNLNLRNKKQTSYISNVDGLDPQTYIKGERRMI